VTLLAPNSAFETSGKAIGFAYSDSGSSRIRFTANLASHSPGSLSQLSGGMQRQLLFHQAGFQTPVFLV
jgi:hypothetical protein